MFGCVLAAGKAPYTDGLLARTIVDGLVALQHRLPSILALQYRIVQIVAPWHMLARIVTLQYSIARIVALTQCVVHTEQHALWHSHKALCQFRTARFIFHGIIQYIKLAVASYYREHTIYLIFVFKLL